ncbi:hypothetical protein AAHA92_10984 [Salvia divinorum]|uniref:DUF674 family protein n=1 Tax=Salvia divinorum TaxID=28513 RepID=A0ABD1HWI0_SALDI
MSDVSEDFKFTLKVMINKEKNKVLFAESDSHFVDTLLSFMTLPMGRIIKLLDNHYGEKAPAIGSLSSLYHSLAHFDSAHFVTKDAKKILLNPRSSFEDKYRMLKLDFIDCQSTEYLYCFICSHSHEPRGVSIYYDRPYCRMCLNFSSITKKDVLKLDFIDSKGVFISDKACFIISDDLQIFPSATGLFRIMSVLCIADMDEADAIDVTIGLDEILSLLKLSFIIPTPLSFLILNKTSLVLDSGPKTLVSHNEIQENPEYKKMVLKLAIQKSKSKVLYAQAEEDFVEFLFSFFNIPLGGIGHLLAGKTCIKAIDNLQRSIAELIGDKYFKSPDMKMNLMKPNLVHGCVSEKYILPLNQECLPADDSNNIEFLPSTKFPKGQGKYLDGPLAYVVMDDLTVTPLCIHSIVSSLQEKNIPMSDVEEMELQVGLKEALSILKASLTSTSALTDALLNSMPIKHPKREV